jgi:hypothetical protein
MTKQGAAIIWFALLVASPGISQPLGTGLNGSPDVPLNHVGGVPNLVPGGLTLVPGTVVVPGVSGGANTGTVPLPGTIGAPGVGTMIPFTFTPPSPGSALYPPTYYPATPSLGTVQSTVPMVTGIPDSSTLIAPATSGSVQD